MPAPPDPLNDEDLLGLDVPDILHALLAPMESPVPCVLDCTNSRATVHMRLCLKFCTPIPNARLMWTMRAWVT